VHVGNTLSVRVIDELRKPTSIHWREISQRTTTFAAFNFSIDYHELTVVKVDIVDDESYVVDHIFFKVELKSAMKDSFLKRFPCIGPIQLQRPVAYFN